jgi:hypothetical protein
MSGGRSDAGDLVMERREEIIDIPAGHGHGEIIEKTTVERRELSPPRSQYGRSRSAGREPIVVNARGPVEIVERSNNIPLGPLVLLENKSSKSDRAIKAEIRALEAEREALRAEQKAAMELRRAEQFRREGQMGQSYGGELIMYEEVEERESRSHRGKEREPDGGVVIKKDKKGRMTMSVPK